jgi:hypothetical protein
LTRVNQLRTDWGKFQSDFFTSSQTGSGNNQALQKLYDEFRRKSIEELCKGKSEDVCQKIRQRNSDRTDLTCVNTLASKVTKKGKRKVPIGETIWRRLAPQTIEEATLEQLGKFGTVEFRTSRIARIFAEKTRAWYSKNVSRFFQNQKDVNFLGMGYGGAAFEIKHPISGGAEENVVVKLPVAKPGTPREQRVADIGDDRKVMTQIHGIPEIADSLFSPKLWTANVNGRIIFPETDAKDLMLLRRQPGFNIYQQAVDESRFWHKQEYNQINNPYVWDQIDDKTLLDLVGFYLSLCRNKIDFHDLFSQNTLYDPETKSLYFVDIYSKPETDKQKGLVNARENFPLETCLFDMLTFLHSFDQNHPIVDAIKTNIRINLMARDETNGNSYDADSTEQEYHQLREARRTQIKRVFKQGIDKKLFTKEELITALNRIRDAREPQTDPFHEHIFGNDFEYLETDFDRLTPIGDKFISSFISELTQK